MSEFGGVAPSDNLVRARFGDDTIEMRMVEEEGRTLFGHFSVFDTWTEIDSRYEGRFLERVAQGSFDQAFRDARNIRVLYEHGGDPSIGNKPIGAPTMLREDDIGAYYEAELFDASYVNDLVPALRAKQLGASFRFQIRNDEWVKPKAASEYNPDRLPERTIRSVSLYEFGPVTWGAYPEATAGVRSGTDSFIDRLLHDPAFVARFTERAGLSVVERILENVPADGRTESSSVDTSADGRVKTTRTKSQRRAAALAALSAVGGKS
jgi:HK97 family phage prohead protease